MLFSLCDGGRSGRVHLGRSRLRFLDITGGKFLEALEGYVARMAVFALWSAPRARSTAFFRSMLERGDMVVVHEPFSDLSGLGETDVDGHPFESALEFLAWLHNHTHGINLFLKDTPNPRHRELFADRRFLAEARHAFLIRRPDEIAASSYAVEPNMRVESIGLETLHRLHSAVRDAGGYDPIVIDSDDLVARPEATMAAYCAAVGLPFIPEALTWQPGDRPEWRRSARWHVDVSASSGFAAPEHQYAHTAETSDELARYAAHHLPFYEQLHAQRLDVAASGG
jgi:Sulfotransferase domain